MTVHVVLAGGGTAGHVEPALALADALRRIDPGIGITALGTATGLEARLVPARGYDLAEVPRVPLPRRLTPQLLGLPWRLFGAVRAVEAVLDRTGASVVVGFGGYVSLPAYLAARRRKVPVVVHEANVRPGVANRIGARLASRVAVSFPDTPLPGACYVGIPLRRAVAELDRDAARAAARASFGLAPDAPTLLVFGGSQGARRINDAVAGAAGALGAVGIQVLHATGAAHADAVRAALTSGDRCVAARSTGAQGGADAGPPPYRVVPYLEQMELAYAAADLALCRAGALTCAELAAVGLPAVYVPLPHGNGEQRLNALPTVLAGGGVLVADAGLDADRVVAVVVPLLTGSGASVDRLAGMGAAAAAHGRRDADERLARMVLAAAAQGTTAPGTDR